MVELVAIVALLCGTGLYAQHKHYASKPVKVQLHDYTAEFIEMGSRMEKLEKQHGELKSSVTRLQLGEGFKR